MGGGGGLVTFYPYRKRGGGGSFSHAEMGTQKVFVHSYVSFTLFKVVLYSEGIYTTNTNDFIHSNCTVLITFIPLLNHYAKKHFNLIQYASYNCCLKGTSVKRVRFWNKLSLLW